MRNITNVRYLESLKKGILRNITDYVKDDNELDLQIRDNYINIYYKGGNILRIKSPNVFEFDEFYFYLDSDKVAKKNVSEKTTQGLKEKRDNLLKLIQRGEIHKYFQCAKECMNDWWKAMANNRGIHHKEKALQHKISRSNSKNTPYIVLDLEYQVSTKSKFAYDGNRDKRMPRFDIIAINNKTGRLCVMELKKDGGALEGKSGVECHIDSFEHTIGRDSNRLFIEEMKNLYTRKKDMKLIEANVDISNAEPEFLFLFQGSNDDRKRLELNARNYRIITLEDNNIIEDK